MRLKDPTTGKWTGNLIPSKFTSKKVSILESIKKYGVLQDRGESLNFVCLFFVHFELYPHSFNLVENNKTLKVWFRHDRIFHDGGCYNSISPF